MFRWLRTVAGDFANAYTLGQLVGSVSGAGIAGILGPIALQPILELPAVLRFVLGLCVFCLALVAILASLEGRRTPTPSAPSGTTIHAERIESLTVQGDPQGGPLEADESAPGIAASSTIQPQVSSGVAGRYPWATDDELSSVDIGQRSLHIFDLARKNVVLRGRTLRDCVVYGPAILAPFYGRWPFDDDCTWQEAGDAASLLWETSTDGEQKEYVGAIGVESDCHFLGCHFIRVGLLMTPDSAKRLREDPTGEGTTNR